MSRDRDSKLGWATMSRDELKYEHRCIQLGRGMYYQAGVFMTEQGYIQLSGCMYRLVGMGPLCLWKIFFSFL